MDRRLFLKAGLVAGGATALGGGLWREALAATAQPGPGPYGGLLAADANGIRLPDRFTSRVVARSGSKVAGTAYTWHPAPDGGATFPRSGGGWVYVSNSEVNGTGGAGAIAFGADGAIERAYRILSGTNRNCSGGATPWGTWLSCEEVSRGRVFECDPHGGRKAVVRPALGRFTHEASAVDPDRKVVYLTEDRTDGRFYRFRPTTWPSLVAGTLQVLCLTSDRKVYWRRVPDPSAAHTSTRYQVPGSKVFNGGEGAFYARGRCYFTTKGDGRVWAYNPATARLGVVYDDSRAGTRPPLTGVDNLTVARSYDIYVAEDGGNMEICLITPAGTVAPFLRVIGHAGSELTGVAFNPAGTRLYFSSQRGSSDTGITYEIRGPFRD
jgi:hypothetical protein